MAGICNNIRLSLILALLSLILFWVNIISYLLLFVVYFGFAFDFPYLKNPSGFTSMKGHKEYKRIAMSDAAEAC